MDCLIGKFDNLHFNRERNKEPFEIPNINLKKANFCLAET